MHPVITASVPLLEPPGWAIAQRELFDLLDRAWRRFAGDFTGPDGRLRYGGRAHHPRRRGRLLRDVLQLAAALPARRRRRPARRVRAALGGRHPAADRAGHAARRVRTRLRLVPPGRKPAAAVLPVHGRARAVARAGAAVRGALRRSRARQLRPRPPHHPPPPQRQRPGPRRTLRRRLVPVAAPRSPDVRLPAGVAAAGGLRAGRADAPAGWGSGDTAVNLAASGLVLNALLLSGEQRYRDWIAEYVGAWRERAAANGGILPDNVAPDGTVGGLLEGRWYGGHYGWSWPHGWYSVGHAAVVARAAAALATGDDTFIDLVRPALDEIIAQGKVMAFTEADSSLESKWSVQLARGRPHAHAARPVPPRRPGLVRLQPDADGASRSRCGTTRRRRRTGTASNGCAPRAATTGRPCGPSAARRRPGTKSPGSPTSPATTPATRSGSWPRRRPRCATG